MRIKTSELSREENPATKERGTSTQRQPNREPVPATTTTIDNDLKITEGDSAIHIPRKKASFASLLF